MMPVFETSAAQKYAHGLPTVSFRVINEDKGLLIPAGVHSVSIQGLYPGLGTDEGCRNRAGRMDVSIRCSS